MGRTFGLLAVVIVVAIGGYVYTRQAQSVTSVGNNPETTIEVTAVRNDLLAIAKAERNHFASTGKYGSLDDLRTAGDITVSDRAHYAYSAEITDNSFTIIAEYSGPDQGAPKRMTVDETMAIKAD